MMFVKVDVVFYEVYHLFCVIVKIVLSVEFA